MKLGQGGHIYSVVVCAHAFIIIFFLGVPVLIWGFLSWLVPMVLGAADIAFPLINRIGLWYLMFGLVILLRRSMIGRGVGAGWDGCSPFAELFCPCGQAR